MARGQPEKQDDLDAWRQLEAESWVMETAEGQALLKRIRGVRAIGPRELEEWRRDDESARVNAGVRLALAQRAAAGKFARADRMWLDPVGVEQATDERVARHKAARFMGRVVVDLCAGVGGDTLALGSIAQVVAVDQSRLACRRLVHNARVYDLNQILVVQARAERFPLPRNAWVHLDPDRRTHSHRPARRLEHYAPGLEFYADLWNHAAAGVIKVSPASDFESAFARAPIEIELVSLRGECKEADLWFGEAVTCTRRASKLPEGVSWTDRDAPVTAQTVVARLGDWIYDPDPALVRAGLLDSFAWARGFARLAHRSDYLTSADRLDDPFLASFQVITATPFDLRKLRAVLKRHNAFVREIKVRGVKVQPERLRQELGRGGDRPLSLLIYQGDERAVVVLGQRASTGGSMRSSDEGAGSAGVDSPKPSPTGCDVTAAS